MKKQRTHRDIREMLKQELKKPELALAYLNEALVSGDKKAFLIALRDVIEARGNITDFAQQADIPRQSIYRMLSEDGNPALDNLMAIIKAMGFKIQITFA